RGIPVVLVDRGAGRQQCSVAVDDVLGGRMAGTHLLEEGHRRIAYVGGPFSIKQVADRHAGLREAIADIDGTSADVRVITGPSLSVAEGRRAGEQIAALPPDERPTAAFCANDLLALGLLQEMTRQGISVPDGIAI